MCLVQMRGRGVTFGGCLCHLNVTDDNLSKLAATPQQHLKFQRVHALPKRKALKRLITAFDMQ